MAGPSKDRLATVILVALAFFFVGGGAWFWYEWNSAAKSIKDSNAQIRVLKDKQVARIVGDSTRRAEIDAKMEEYLKKHPERRKEVEKEKQKWKRFRDSVEALNR